MALVVIIVIEVLLFCVLSISRHYPTNLILLLVFTFCFSYCVGYLCSLSEPLEILIALSVAVCGFASMTIYGMVTEFDITVFWSVLFGGSVALIVLLTILFFVPCQTLFVVFCYFGVLLGLIYVAYDTQLILGDRKYELTEDDYISAAMMLYVDFLSIFLYAL